MRDRLVTFTRALPMAHRVAIVAALAVVAMLAVPFVGWITTPTYTVLYSGLDDVAVAEVVDGLERQGVPYQLEAGGSRVLVPREHLYTTRAALAAEGVGGRTTPAGYELLDEQGLSVSDFRQRVDYRRALEGELARTLSAMEGIREATVHLVIPERELFADRQQPVTASVLVATRRPLDQSEVEAVTFLVASSVEGLETGAITVADASGAVLHAPGDGSGSVATNRNLRQTREFEQALAGDIAALLERVTGTPASVVVRATLNYDESETHSETFDADSQVAVREQTSQERYEGTGAVPGGTVGVDGGPLETDAEESAYEKEETLREYGVDRITSRTVAAPGRVDGLSVAIVADDGTVTGAQVPPDAELEQLVSAAVGLVPERGDAIAVTTLPFPRAEEPEPAEAEPALLGYLPQAIGGVVLVVVCLLLFLMTRRKQVTVESIERTARPPEELPAAAEASEPAPEPEPAMVGAPLHAEVVDLVERQPEEIATLLRGWLADRRGQ